MTMAMRGVLVCLALLVAVPGLAEQPAPALVPWPRSVEFNPGELEFGPKTRIAAASAELQPLARTLTDEMQATLGLRPEVVAGLGGPGDIVLVEEATLKGEAYAVDVADRATVRGGNYGAVALGTATLLQAFRLKDGKATLPRMTVTDEPAVEFRGLMVDVARKYHSIASLRQMIQLCRLYKIRYLQLHLTDDQSFMFPSKAYPQLATQNEHRGKTYTLEELKDLVAYADARNVTIIPEYEVPGHSAAALRAMPDLFKPHGAKPDDAGVVVPPEGKVFGAQLCAWEQPEAAELPSLRHRLPAMAERIWNPEAGRDFADFSRRAEAADRLLDRLLQ